MKNSNTEKKSNIGINAALNAFRYIMKIVLPLLTFPYVTRVLMPTNYGKVNYCASIISYFALIGTLGSNEYAVREGVAFRDNRDKMEMFASQIFTIEIISTTFSYLLICIFLAIWHADHDYKQIFLIQSISILLTTLGIEWIYTIYEDFAYITLRSFLVQIISIVLVFLLIQNKNDYKLYAAISTVAVGAGNIFNFVHARKYISLKLTKSVDLKKHIKPILILFCNVALISIYLNSDKTLLGILIGDEAVGLYEVSVKIYTMIKGVLNAIVLVSLPRLSSYLRNNKYEHYNKLASKTLSSQFIILFPVIVGLYMVSREVILLIAGEQYMAANSSLRILSIALLFAVFANFYAYVIMMSQRMDKQILIATVLSAVLNITLNMIAIPKWGISGAALTTLLAELSVTLLGVYFCKGRIRISIRKQIIIGTAIGCFGIILICEVVDQFAINLVYKLLIKIFGSVLFYSIIQIIINRSFIKSIFKENND